MHEETAPLVREVQELKAEIVALRKEMSAAASSAASKRAKRASRAPN